MSHNYVHGIFSYKGAAMNNELGGRKDDDGKTRWDLLPWDALEEMAKVLTHACTNIPEGYTKPKYPERNWEKGMAYGRLIRAAIGHITSWAMRRDVDDETGLSHLAHAGCCILFLLAYSLRNVGEDNRPMKKQYHVTTKDGDINVIDVPVHYGPYEYLNRPAPQDGQVTVAV